MAPSGSGGAASAVLLAASDDGTVSQWGPEGEFLGVVHRTGPEWGLTDMHAPPSQSPTDIFAVGGSDGTLRIFAVVKGGPGGGASAAGASSGGGGGVSIREEKCVTGVGAAGGALISVRWSWDGGAVVTGGEDGSVKVWSRAGMLRTHLVTAPRPVYAVRWGADNNSILYAAGRELCITSVTADASAGGRARGLTWKAHDGVVLAVDWNPVTSRIVSGGEDCKYRVWDSLGRQLFVSAPFDNVVTSLAWSPSGEQFAVGTYNMLRLCNASGWGYSREKTATGSLVGLSWTADGTLVAAGGGAGHVLFGALVDRALQWGSITATMKDTKKVCITENGADVEELDFRDRVVEFALGHGHLVVATATQCHIYSTTNWHTPHIFDLRAPVTLILLAARHFALVDAVAGVTLYTFDGRTLSNPKYAGMRNEFLTSSTLALSVDSLAILDRTDGKTIRCFDVRTGRAVGTPIVHTAPVLSIALSQFHAGGLPERKLAILDASHDLYLTPIVRPSPFKLAGMVDSVAWNDSSDMLAVLGDGRLSTWLYPQAVFSDLEIASAARVVADPAVSASFGQLPTILSFQGSRLTAQRGDGALVSVNVANYPPLLYELVAGAKWEQAVRLCRFAKAAPLWAALAAMAIAARHLDTAEIALAAIGAVDKLHFVMHIQDLPLPELRNAELALYRRSPEEAESILLQVRTSSDVLDSQQQCVHGITASLVQASPPLVYRAIKLNIRLARWQRALDLALQHGVHVDTVLWYRSEFLASVNRRESLESFLKAAATTGPLDPKAILAKKQAEKDREKARGSAGERAGAGSSRAPAPAPAPAPASAPAPAAAPAPAPAPATATARSAAARSPVPRSGSSASNGSAEASSPRGRGSARGRATGAGREERNGGGKLAEPADEMPDTEL